MLWLFPVTVMDFDVTVGRVTGPMTGLIALEAALVLPAASVAVAVKVCEPFVSAPVVKFQAPLGFVVVVPRTVWPS